MRKSEIEVGGGYRNKSGSVRQVLERGVDSGDWWQLDTDCLEYLVLRGPGEGKTRCCTVAAFARWASARVIIQCDWILPHPGGYNNCRKVIGHSGPHEDIPGLVVKADQRFWVINPDHEFVDVSHAGYVGRVPDQGAADV